MRSVVEMVMLPMKKWQKYLIKLLQKLKQTLVKYVFVAGNALLTNCPIQSQVMSKELNVVFIEVINLLYNYFNEFNHLQKHVEMNKVMTKEVIKDTIDQLRGAVTIVYPMGLPPHDPIRLEFEDSEDLTGNVIYEIFLCLLLLLFTPCVTLKEQPKSSFYN